MDPDHPLAALVRKAKQERNGTIALTAKPEELVAPPVQPTPADYTTDREYDISSTQQAAGRYLN